MVAGNAWSGTAVAAIQPLAVGEPGILRLRTADFPPLQSTFGAVRLAFNALGQVAPMPPFIVSRDDTDYFVVSAECTHQACLIPAFSATKTSTCPCHGSRFGHDGRVIRGPAGAPLTRYEVSSQEPGMLAITLPEIPGYNVSIDRVQASGTPRTALAFQSLTNVEYEILGRASSGSEWVVQSFAQTETGPSDKRSLKATGGRQVVYVESAGSSAMFVVSAKVRQV